VKNSRPNFTWLRFTFWCNAGCFTLEKKYELACQMAGAGLTRQLKITTAALGEAIDWRRSVLQLAGYSNTTASQHSASSGLGLSVIDISTVLRATSGSYRYIAL